SSGLHEYTGDYARYLARETAPVSMGQGARFVLFASRPDASQAAKIDFQGLRLLRTGGQSAVELASGPLAEVPPGAELSPGVGVRFERDLALAFAAEVDAGALVLEWREPKM